MSGSGGQKPVSDDMSPDWLSVLAKWLFYISWTPVALLVLEVFLLDEASVATGHRVWYYGLAVLCLSSVAGAVYLVDQYRAQSSQLDQKGRRILKWTLVASELFVVAAVAVFLAYPILVNRETWDVTTHDSKPESERVYLEGSEEPIFQTYGSNAPSEAVATSVAQPELKITGKTVSRGTAGLPNVRDWDLSGRGVGDLKVRLLLAQNGKTNVVQEFDFEELPDEFSSKVRLEVKDAATGADRKRRVNAILHVQSPVNSRCTTTNEDKGLSIAVEAPFSNSIDRELKPVSAGETELLLARCYWKGDMTHGTSMESMIEATNDGKVTFLFVTLDWKPVEAANARTRPGRPERSGVQHEALHRSRSHPGNLAGHLLRGQRTRRAAGNAQEPEVHFHGRFAHDGRWRTEV